MHILKYYCLIFFVLIPCASFAAEEEKLVKVIKVSCEAFDNTVTIQSAYEVESNNSRKIKNIEQKIYYVDDLLFRVEHHKNKQIKICTFRNGQNISFNLDYHVNGPQCVRLNVLIGKEQRLVQYSLWKEWTNSIVAWGKTNWKFVDGEMRDPKCPDFVQVD